MTAAPRRERRENALLVLARIPIVRRMWAAITFSSLGDWLGLLANTALAQQLTQDSSKATQGVAFAGVFLVRLAPDLFFGAFAAAIADKMDRRKTVIIADVTAGVLYASIAIGYNLLWLYIAQFVIEAAGLFSQPAKQVIQVSIVPKKLLATANQISLFSVYGTVPIAAGLFALLSAGDRLISGQNADIGNDVNYAIVIALAINAVSFFVSSATVFFSRRDIHVVPAEREQQQSILSLLREGVAYVAGDSLIRGLYIGIIGAFAAGGLTIGVARLWVETLDAGTAGFAIMFGTLFTGLAIGMLLGPRVLPSYPRSRVVGMAIGGAGVTLLVMSLIRDFILADVLAALVGLCAGVAWIVGYTLIGLEVEDRLRGRIFAFVLSSVRLMLLLSIAVGPVVAGSIGSHTLKVGDDARLTFSGPGLTLLLGGLVALGVSLYTTSRAGGRPGGFRELIRRRIVGAGMRHPDHTGLFVTVDGLDADATAAYAELVAQAIRTDGYVVVSTAEPTRTATGRRVSELLLASAHTDDGAGVEAETAALLSAADRAEHVAAVIRPALVRGEIVVCDHFTLTSLALHGGGRGADVERIRSVNAWSTGDLKPDLVVVVDSGDGVDGSVGAALTGAVDDLDAEAARRTLLDEATADPARYLVCPADHSGGLPDAVVTRLNRLLRSRASLVARTPSAPADSAVG
ncbi:bifunctional MFS transporter/dTMP kinase [uncultured Jatrophihabitans sp.]|uniref:bifunctional MFS transporter/dTMP kinase n=1 Tax=uncultured Jatrophihabitans sp. TaxID=1610747 RepID=UPI0035CA831E